MAERGALTSPSPFPPNKALTVFGNHLIELQNEIVDPTELYHHLSADLLNCYGHGDCYTTSGLSPIILTYRLLNSVRMAISKDQEELLKFLEVLQVLSGDSLKNIALRMRNEFEGTDGLIGTVRDESCCQPTFEDRMADIKSSFIVVQKMVKNDVAKAHVSTQDIKSILFFSCHLRDEWDRVSFDRVSFDRIDDVLDVVFKHCSLLNHDILLHIVGRFQLTNALSTILSYENEQQYYCRQLMSSDFIQDLNRTLCSSISDSFTTRVSFEFPVKVLSCTTVSEFNLILFCIFSELASFLHLSGIEFCNESLTKITLHAPEGLRQLLISKAKFKKGFIKDIIGATSLTIGKPSTCTLTIGKIVIFEDPNLIERQESQGSDVSEPEKLNEKNKDIKTSTENELNIKNESQVQNEEEGTGIATLIVTQQQKPTPDKCFEDPIHGPSSSSSVTQAASTVIQSPYRLCKALKKITQVEEVTVVEVGLDEFEATKQRKRLHSWRQFKPQDRDVLIIGSFGSFHSEMCTVASKIVPSDLRKDEWTKEEMKEVVSVYEKYNERFDIYHSCCDLPGEEKPRQDYIDHIKGLFHKRNRSGAVIWYTGHGEKNTGNWCFKDGVITFEDIFNLYVCNYKGRSLTIVSDCSYSGSWINECARKMDESNIPACGHHARNNKILIKIIASCQHNEEATALAFIKEGLSFDEVEKGIMHCPDSRVLKSGQKTSGIDFRAIRCDKESDEICEIQCNESKYTWSDCVPCKLELIYTVSGTNEDQENVWHCVLIDEEKVSAFTEAVAAGDDIDVQEYGEVLESGSGLEPPATLYQELELRFVKCMTELGHREERQ